MTNPFVINSVGDAVITYLHDTYPKTLQTEHPIFEQTHSPGSDNPDDFETFISQLLNMPNREMMQLWMGWHQLTGCLWFMRLMSVYLSDV